MNLADKSSLLQNLYKKLARLEFGTKMLLYNTKDNLIKIFLLQAEELSEMKNRRYSSQKKITL